MPGTSFTRGSRSLGSMVNPCTISSEDDTDPDRIDSDDEVYEGPGASKRKKKRKRQTSGTTTARSPSTRSNRPTSSIASKTKALSLPRPVTPEPIRNDDQSTRDPSRYRQPACLMIPNIKQDQTWKDGYGRTEEILDTAKGNKQIVKRARNIMETLLDDEIQWGIVEKGTIRNAGGRCMPCYTKKVDCVVQLGQSSARGAPYEVVSRCIRCIVSHAPCDIFIGEGNARDGISITPEKLKPAPPPTPKFVESIGIPPHHFDSPPISRKSTKRPIFAASASEEPSISKSKVQPRGQMISGGKVSIEEVKDAVNDVAEFVEDMRRRSSKNGKMDIGSRGMFSLVDSQMDILQQFAEALE